MGPYWFFWLLLQHWYSRFFSFWLTNLVMNSFSWFVEVGSSYFSDNVFWKGTSPLCSFSFLWVCSYFYGMEWLNWWYCCLSYLAWLFSYFFCQHSLSQVCAFTFLKILVILYAWLSQISISSLVQGHFHRWVEVSFEFTSNSMSRTPWKAMKKLIVSC